MLTEDDERHTVGELRAEVNDWTCGLVHAREADVHHEQTQGQVTNKNGSRLILG